MDGTGLCTDSNCGIVISVETDEFMRLMKQAGNALIIHQQPSWWQTYNRYLMSYRGMAFYTRSKEELSISKYAEVIAAKNFYVPHTM